MKGGTSGQRARKHGRPTTPGIGRKLALNRDGWVCLMPQCLLENRAIDPAVRRIGQGTVPDDYGNRDHIVPLSNPESPGDVWSNVRAAHTRCNGQAVTNPPSGLRLSTGAETSPKARDPAGSPWRVEARQGVTRRRRSSVS